MLYQLFYSSISAKKMMKSHLYMILRQARLNNKLSNVTGLLVFVDGLFLQVLEGEESAVKNIFENIKSDKRHGDINILFEGNVKERAFPNWEMAYASPSARDLANWSGLNNTTNIKETILNIENDKILVPHLLVELLRNIDSTEQNPGIAS